MSIALLTLCNVDVVDKSKEMVPLEDITISVLHWGHDCELEFDQYCFDVIVGTTVAEIKEKLLDAKFYTLWMVSR